MNPNISESTLQITINGEERAVTPMSIAELMRALALDPKRVAIERNQAIVPRSAYDSTPLSAGDRLEIVGFIGGG